MKSNFSKVPEKISFPKEEEKVLAYWKEIDAFKEQLRLSEGRQPYTFYDGPPFATGHPHYGHITAGTIKDVVTRYATQTGRHCKRRFGWDTHGLPVEHEIEKQYGIKSSVEREQLGIQEYNRRCREIVMKFSGEWEQTVSRFGRWIDFQDDYKTMDCNFMESVWWTFKQIFDKGLVYQGAKIMPFSTACNTVLANFEVQDSYADLQDPSVFVTFPLVDEPGTSLLAWTTTPWTLPSNLACAVHPNFDYLKFRDEDTGKVYVVAEELLEDVLSKNKINNHQVLDKFKGSRLEGKKYQPLYRYFASWGEAPRNCFRVLTGKFVTMKQGTGVVHCAPGFGEDDYNVCLEHGLITPEQLVMPVDVDGKFKDEITDFKGLYIKHADKLILKDLKQRQRVVTAGTITHSYPVCWRSGTPLIYRATKAWFIKVTQIKEELLQNNEDPRWVPEWVQNKRFRNWLMDVRDWCVSRDRYWGNPIPLWVSDDFEEVVCVGSIKELQELTGCGEITDLHREHVDHLTIPSKKGKGVLRRIPEVFDCWFESGSMPFAQSHYPFSVSDEEFMKGFPANFIAEGIDQTRGWFYTLMVVSTIVKNQAPFKNLVVNGTLLNEKGEKLSKSKKNYPDPMKIVNTHGADACRLYLLNSPVVKAESLKFKEAGVKSVVKEVFLPWFNAYRLLVQNITRYETTVAEHFVFDAKLKTTLGPDNNFMDRWIVSANQNLIKLVRAEMDCYQLYNVMAPLLDFLEKLTNWYVRLNRLRLKGDEGVEEQRMSLNILFDVLLSTTTLMSCVTPFLTEYLYQNLRNGIDPEDKDLYQKSVHFLQIPDCDERLLDEKVEKRFMRMQSAIKTGRGIRNKRKTLPLKQPLKCVLLVDKDQEALDDYQRVASYIKEELNCLELKTDSNEEEYLEYACQPDNALMGEVLNKRTQKNGWMQSLLSNLVSCSLVGLFVWGYRFCSSYPWRSPARFLSVFGVFGVAYMRFLPKRSLREQIEALTSSQLQQYLQKGSMMLDGLKIEAGWLKVERRFKQKYQNSTECACACSTTSNVLLVTTLDETLVRMGHSREMTNRIQKLRKDLGISIEDQIEVFYEAKEAENSQLLSVLQEYSDQIRQVIKKPFLPASQMPKDSQRLGETKYADPENANDVVQLYVCKPAVII